jgi:argininosuccinate synthase
MKIVLAYSDGLDVPVLLPWTAGKGNNGFKF